MARAGKQKKEQKSAPTAKEPVPKDGPKAQGSSDGQKKGTQTAGQPNNQHESTKPTKEPVVKEASAGPKIKKVRSDQRKEAMKRKKKEAKKAKKAKAKENPASIMPGVETSKQRKRKAQRMRKAALKATGKANTEEKPVVTPSNPKRRMPDDSSKRRRSVFLGVIPPDLELDKIREQFPDAEAITFTKSRKGCRVVFPSTKQADTLATEYEIDVAGNKLKVHRVTNEKRRAASTPEGEPRAKRAKIESEK